MPVKKSGGRKSSRGLCFSFRFVNSKNKNKIELDKRKTMKKTTADGSHPVGTILDSSSQLLTFSFLSRLDASYQMSESGRSEELIGRKVTRKQVLIRSGD